jgi:pimeloyl-ACP methyl ester carboxylesterase
MPFYDAADAAIYYEIAGTGKPVIFLHGYALNSLMWQFQMPALVQKFQVIAVDLRGFGQSSCKGNWSGNVMADDIAGLIGELDLKDCAVLGFSMSGPIAIRLALNQSDRISRLILVSSILPSTGKPEPKARSRSQQKELETLKLNGVLKWADALGLRRGPLVENMFKRNPRIERLWENIIARHKPDFLRCMMEARANTISNIDWRSRLPEISQPTLIIAGAQDRSFLDASGYLHRHIPGSKLEPISGAGHMVNLEKPDDFNRILISFLESG